MVSENNAPDHDNANQIPLRIAILMFPTRAKITDINPCDFLSSVGILYFYYINFLAFFSARFGFEGLDIFSTEMFFEYHEVFIKSWSHKEFRNKFPIWAE